MTKMHLTVAAALIGALIPLFAGQASATKLHAQTNFPRPTLQPQAPAAKAQVIHEGKHVPGLGTRGPSWHSIDPHGHVHPH